MMSLWDVNGILNVRGDPKLTVHRFDQPQNRSGSTRAPSRSIGFHWCRPFKIQIEVHGNHAWLYFGLPRRR